MTYPNGVVHTYSYDQKNRLTNLAVNASSGPIESYGYTLDNAGHRTAVTELSGRTVNYGYDNIYRLTSEAVFADPSGDNGTINYTYDAVGNRTQQTSTNPAITSGGFGYDADDRLTTDSYDANGNTIGSGGLAYSYDFENHLIQQGGATFVYDGDGNRVEKIVGGVTTKYLVSEVNPTGYPQVVNESFSGGTGARELSHAYVYGLDRSIGSIERNGTKPHGEARVCIFQCGMAAIAGANARRYTRLDYRHYPDGRPRPIRIFSQSRAPVLCGMAWDFVSSARAANDFAAVLSIPGAVRPSSAGALHSSSECRIRAA